MATRSDIEAQVRELRNFLRSPHSRKLTPQHREVLDKRLYDLEDALSGIEDIEGQVGFRNKKFLKGIGNLALNFLQMRLPFLRGTKGKQVGPPGNIYDVEYEVLGESELPSIEKLITPPAGPPIPEGHIAINLPPIEPPPPVDFTQPIIGPEADDNYQKYYDWQNKIIEELPRKATTEQFINSQKEFLDMHTRGLQERLNLNPSQVKRIKTSFEDYVGTHWNMFDPSIEANRADGFLNIISNVAEHIEGMADTLVKQAANVGIGSLTDMRFEAVATNPDYAIDKDTQQPLVPDPVFTPEIDRVFLSTSPLRQFLAGRKKGDLDPATILDELGVELTDKGTGFKNIDNRGFNTQAVDSGVANLLRNRMRSGETITKEELVRVLDHHRGQFSTELTLGEDTSHGNAGFGDLLRQAESAAGFRPRRNDDFEIVSKYRPVLEEEGQLGSSPFSLSTGSSHNWASDPIGDQHFWLRGEVLEYPDDLKGGSVGEIQSDMGWADSPNNPDYTWLSNMTDTGSEEITDIKNRQEGWRNIVAQVKNESRIENKTLLGISDLVKGKLPLTYHPQQSWIEYVANELSKHSPTFTEKYQKLQALTEEKAKEYFIDDVVRGEQPLAGEFGIELQKSDLDVPIDFSHEPNRKYMSSTSGLDNVASFSHWYGKPLARTVRANYNLGVEEALPQIANLQNMVGRSYIEAMDHYSEEYYELLKNNLDPLIKANPEIAPLIEMGPSAPTEAELEKLATYQEQQSSVTSLADFPMKQTYPRYSARALIQKGLEQGWDTVEIPNLPPGQRGATDNYNKATKELKKIADEFNLPLQPRSATMRTTGEEGGGMANREVTFYRLDIRPLRALIEAKKFKGFKGMKHGGLVTKAQGAGYNINYGDYGRSYN